MGHSPFMSVPATEWIACNALAFAIRDRYPVSPGHALVITMRVVPTWFEATPAEKVAVLELVEVVKRGLDASTPPPDGYNIGFNAGEAAGQTVMHLHLHVIPRYRGDMDDPRGGVRHVIPSKGNYLRSCAGTLAKGGVADPFAAHLRPLLDRASEIAIVAAFVQESGLGLLEPGIFGALRRGARARLLTGDYLHITQKAALERLLDWSSAWAAPELRAGPEGEPANHEVANGRFEVAVIETDRLPAPTRSFHPKSWRFEGEGLAVAFVGSSNISDAALRTGIEWNLRVDRDRDARAFDQIAEAFEALWLSATPLTAAWVARYTERARLAQVGLPPGETEAEPLPEPPEPHAIQREALEHLARSHADGRGRALVVLATGLGKTWLAAFDAERFFRERGRAPHILVIAHRTELLAQAAETFRRMLRRSFPDAIRVAWFAGDRSELDGDLVLASVQKLARAEHLARLSGLRFDYVVIDEVHHADGPSYRRIVERLDAAFVLGLTATPDRADEGDILGLLDDHLAYRADLGVGIERGLLVPFAYWGLKDDVDYRAIPWRNRRFDPEALSRAVETETRMAKLWEAWGAHPGARTLVFCCSIEHAHFACGWLEARGVRARAVHSGPGSADREIALRDLAAGALDAICAVDLFNEGVDLPDLDRVVMLRPTESPILFLQQLGRGLRIAERKKRLTVIDFVGNHRIFLDRVRLLAALGTKPQTVASFIAARMPVEVLKGCTIDIELEAIDLLRRLLPSGGTEVERAYKELVAARGERPTAGELYRLGYRPSTLHKAHGSWFGFLATLEGEEGLTEAERRAFEASRPWLDDLEKTALSKSFKLVVLEVLLEAGALGTGLPVPEIARRSHALLVRSPELFRDIDGVKELGDARDVDERVWLAYWRANPISAWTGKGRGGRAWFRLEGEQLVPAIPLPDGDDETFSTMTRELVDYRLAQYRARTSSDATGAGFECRVLSNQRDPILKLPSRATPLDLPTGETDVRLPDGQVWRFRFMKEFCNVARPVGTDRNAMPDLLRQWFGPGAGRPGTAFAVRFSRAPDGWWAEPAGERVVQPPTRGRVVAYPTLRAAAGLGAGTAEAPVPEEVLLPVESADPEVFAVRASGDSMDGGKSPIRDGDWLVMRYARRAGLGALEGRIALVERPGDDDEQRYQVKRIVRQGERRLLRSENLDRPTVPAPPEAVAIATLIRAIRPEDLAPTVGARIPDADLATTFGVAEPVRTGRVDGHLFLCVETPGAFAAPDRLALRFPDRRPGETAFVVTRAAGEAAWRYAGVGRWIADDGAWAIPSLDFATWRALGASR